MQNSAQDINESTPTTLSWLRGEMMPAAERFLDCVKGARADIAENDADGADSKSERTVLDVLGKGPARLGQQA